MENGGRIPGTASDGPAGRGGTESGDERPDKADAVPGGAGGQDLREDHETGDHYQRNDDDKAGQDIRHAGTDPAGDQEGMT